MELAELVLVLVLNPSQVAPGLGQEEEVLDLPGRLPLTVLVHDHLGLPGPVLHEPGKHVLRGGPAGPG